MKAPEIRIFLSWLLLNGESKTLAGNKKLENYEQFEKWTNNYRTEWRKYEQNIIPALQTALGINFYKPIIDVACAPYFVPKSDPLIMSFKNEPDEFVDVLTHELCHVLLTDNDVFRQHDDNPKVDLIKIWQKLFGNSHDFHALVHIPVHALSKYIYMDILNEPSRLDRDIESLKKFKPYADAWEYVNKNDYKTIIKDLKKSYQEMPT